MDECRSETLGRLAPGGELLALDLPADAVSLVVSNALVAPVYVRWGEDRPDPTTRTGYDLAIPGRALLAFPIPRYATKVSIAVGSYAAPDGGDAYDPAQDAASSALVVAASTNQGVFVGAIGSGDPARVTVGG